MHRHANVNVKDAEGRTALDVAIMSGKNEIRDFLVTNHCRRNKQELSVVLSSLSFIIM